MLNNEQPKNTQTTYRVDGFSLIYDDYITEVIFSSEYCAKKHIDKCRADNPHKEYRIVKVIEEILSY
jgi:hypothetical protein